MIHIPKHIQELMAYNPGKTIEEYRADFGFSETAILWNNENNLGVPPKAVSAMQEAAKHVNVYPDPLSLELREVIAKTAGVEQNQVSVENGSESILSNIFKAFMLPGDEFLTSEGTFVAVYIWAKAANATLKKVPLTSSFSFHLNAIKQQISPNTKVVYLSNPNNPTGTIFTKRELDFFLKDLPPHVVVVIDEAYFEYARVLRGDYPDSTTLNHPQVITLRTFSKAYGLAGVRLGYAISTSTLIEPLNKIKMTFAPSSVTQAAGIGALNDKRFMEQTMRLNLEAIELYKAFFRELNIPYAETAANFIMIDLKNPEKAQRIALELLKEGVFVRWLRAFGLSNCLRISTGLPEENEHFKSTFKKIWE